MISTLLRIGFINLRRDRVAQALTFLLPIMFFSIFATVFGNQRDPTRKINVALVDEDGTPYSRRLTQALAAEGGLHVRTTVEDAPAGAGHPLDRAAAEKLVRAGTLPIAVILPKGLEAGHHLFGGDANGPKVQLLADISDPIAPQMVQGLLEEVSFTAAPDELATQGIDTFTRFSGPLTPRQQQSVNEWMASITQRDATAAAGGGTRAAANIGLPMEVVNVMQTNSGDINMISFYAAGVGVMFLLFSSSGAGGALLDEVDSGTLGRLLGSRAGMGGVLAGKWAFIAISGCLQLTVMFVWGALVFHLPLMSHLPGFAVMSLVTAAAAAAFGLVLATISRSRAQLSGISTILILSMSAVGGSMFPRFLMSDTMQRIGKITFNAWALDGFQKVFWRSAPILDLWPEVSVLVGLTIVFLAAARLFARRWEAL